MTLEIFAALALFCFVTSITPGPNNIMLMASGANFGFRRTLPHMLGIGLGFTFMIVMLGLVLMQVFEVFPWIRRALNYVCLAYLLYLAWKIANAAAPVNQSDQHSNNSGNGATGKPLTFIQAALFQWVNPKAWTMALAALTLYAPDRTTIAILWVAGVFGAINLPSVSTWTLIGLQVRRLLTDQRKLVIFNYSMAFLLILSMVPMLF